MGCLRLLLALAVVADHTDGFSFNTMMNGGEAVRLFFVISGFYMALILQTKYHTPFIFYSNRFLRLYPTYVLVLLLSMGWFLVVWRYTHNRPPPFWIAEANEQMKTWQWVALQLSNLTMIGLDLPALFHWKVDHGFLFMAGPADTLPDGAQWGGRFIWVGQAWSIGTEIWFYLLAPLVARWKVKSQIALALASLGLMHWMGAVALEPYFFPANLWLFLSGCLLFRFYKSSFCSSVPDWIGFIALAYVLVACCLIGAVGSRVVHATMLISIAACVPILFKAFARRPWDRSLGNLSYPIYLLHLMVIAIFAAAFRVQSGLAIATVTTFGAMLIVRFIENPMDKFRQGRIERMAVVNVVENKPISFVGAAEPGKTS